MRKRITSPTAIGGFGAIIVTLAIFFAQGGFEEMNSPFALLYIGGLVIGIGMIVYSLVKRPAKEGSLKKKRIELIKAERYPTKVPSILRRMEQRMTVLMEKAKRQKVTKAQLDMLMHTIFPDLSDMEFKGYKAEIVWLWKFQSYMEASGFGLVKAKRSDSEWNTLIAELDDIKKDVPDQELKDHIRDYVIALDGVYSWNLWGHYIHKTNTQLPKELATAIQAKTFRQDLLEHTFTRIKKRIDELLSGEEPKWTLR
jgi:hypothetical protein